MTEQLYNPYLPLTEYIPDGEPHVFGNLRFPTDMRRAVT